MNRSKNVIVIFEHKQKDVVYKRRYEFVFLTFHFVHCRQIRNNIFNLRKMIMNMIKYNINSILSCLLSQSSVRLEKINDYFVRNVVNAFS